MSSHDNKAFDKSTDDLVQDEKKQSTSRISVRSDKNKIHPFEMSDTKQTKSDEIVDGGNKEGGGEEDVERENWSGKLDFFLSALSYSVGLGAVWRFPYLCYKNGGGAFLVPFFLFLLLVGIPIVYMELSVGQFTSRGPVLSWVMTPLFKGVGISMNLINNYVNIYYIMIIAYSLYYLVLSMRATLPWEKCNPKWASPNCVDNFDPSVFNFTFCDNPVDETTGEVTEMLYYKCDDGKCYLNVTDSIEEMASCDMDNKTLVGWWNPIFPSQDYWNKVVLQKSEDIGDLDGLVWQLVVSLFAAWIVCFLCLFRGVKLSGKIVYFTALFPYLVLFILGIRALFLDGASIGIEYYITPRAEKLLDATVWKDAAVQVFFTLSLSYGGLVALSSYNRYNHNVLRDTFILSVSNFLTCILAGFVVFAYMGALSFESGIAIDKVVQSGQGLVYIVYPYAATTLEGAPVWAVMFFVMMLALGMGTMMASVETLTTSLEDFFPVLKKTALIKAATLGIICVLYFLIGLLLCSHAGTYWIELFDEYSANYGIIIICLIECLSVGWFYGTKKFKYDMLSTIDPTNETLKTWHNRAFIMWMVCWQYVTPILLIALVIFTLTDSKPLELGDYTFPEWSHILGTIISVSSLLGIVGWIIYEIVLVKYYKTKTFRDLVSRDPAWKPLLHENRKKWIETYENLGEYLDYQEQHEHHANKQHTSIEHIEP